MTDGKTGMEMKILKKGYLDVSGGHSLYFEVVGNPRGIPVLFLHGGPGVGFDEGDKRFFQNNKWKVIFFDQRGSGRSRPFASIENNNTQLLIADIHKLLTVLGIKKVLLFGGSWGSTLGLVFAITSPELVSGMLLRGIYLATKEENEYLYGGAVAKFFPEVWERFIGIVPDSQRKNAVEYYFHSMISDTAERREKYAYEWSYYESSLLKLKNSEKKIKYFLKKSPFLALSIIESYYISHNCFLSDGYILKNISKISDIPTVIVQGRYDFVCPPKGAMNLSRLLPNSKLYLTIAGHSSSEIKTENKLIEQLDYFYTLFSKIK